MATAPLLKYFDNSGSTTNLLVTTNVPYIYLNGLVDQTTVDVQINLNGTGFVSDPTLVGINLPNFTVPNLYSHPGGLPLENGVNTIELRAVDLSGNLSPTTTATINFMPDIDIGTVYGPPTGVTIERYHNRIELNWSDVNLSNVSGYNVYASTGPGGTDSGYLRLNAQLIPANSPKSTSYSESNPQSVTYDFAESSISDIDLAITISTINVADGVEVERKTKNTFSLLPSPKYRVGLTFSNLDVINHYTFSHQRDSDVAFGILNSDVFGYVPTNVPIYYIVTAVYIDSVLNTMVESRYSVELAGSPLAPDANIRGIQIREQSTVAQDYIKTLQTVAPELSLIPGSTVREIHVEPFSNEIQKAYFLMDFVHRAKSFPALLNIDDPNRTGVSIPVSNSQYKQNLKTALSVSDDNIVQSLIDNAFDSLASNFAIKRRGRQFAVVEQTFFTTKKPVKDLYVNQNAMVRSSSSPTAPRFMTKGQQVLPAATSDRYYNSEKRRYELKVQMIAEVSGSSGNLPAGILDTVVSGAFGFSTINESASHGGTDIQSNMDLANQASHALVSLDTGTSGGYERVVSSVAGVINYLVVRSGDEYMMRDYDPIRMKHIGGKVDVYIKGSIDRSITETFAFQFDVAHSIRFDVIDPINFVFRARDSRLSVNNPIQEMLFIPNENYGLYNQSNLPTTAYDLTGVQIVDYKTIKLNSLIPQPQTKLDDFVEGDYRFRSTSKFILSIQPVDSVSTVVGESSGALSPGDGFNLFKLQDPVVDGNSTISSDYVQINQVNNIPSGLPININDETHVLIGQIEESLMSIGINVFSINVYSGDRLTLYNGPDNVNPDYLIIPGTQTSPIKIVRTINSNIPNGSTVSVDYEHDENFEVTYTVNDVIERAQTELDKFKHITADVIAKQAVSNPLDIIATIQLKPGYTQSTVDNNIRTAYSRLIDSKNVGDPVHVSDVVATIDNVEGVDFLVQPFAKMSLQDGAMRVRDPVANEFIFLPNISLGTNAVYILTEELPYATMDGGGDSYTHHGVYMDNIMMNASPSLGEVANVVNSAWVIGNRGAVIDGYSDDTTLSKSFDTTSEIEAERIRLTANRVLVSLDYGQTPPDYPSNHKFSVTYTVDGETGVKDVDTSQIEYLTTGTLTLTFRKA